MPSRSLTAASAASFRAGRSGERAVLPGEADLDARDAGRPELALGRGGAVVFDLGDGEQQGDREQHEEREDPQHQAASLEDVHASPPAYESAAHARAHQSSRSGSWLTIMSNIGWKLNQPADLGAHLASG